MFVDSHCHLDFPDLASREDEILATMAANDVGTALCISVKLEDFPRVRSLAERHAHLWATVGVHPDNDGVEEPDVARLVSLADHPKVVAIGETGLDYYRLSEPLDWQRDRFRRHIRAARTTGLPLIVHTRSSAADTVRMLREEGAAEVGGVMHCFTETWEIARQAMDQNFHISLSGIVTFKNAQVVHDVATRMPLDRLLIETDSPYLAPVPHRGKLNDPAKVVHVAERIAQLKGIPVEDVAQASTENFFKLFNKIKR